MSDAYSPVSAAAGSPGSNTRATRRKTSGSCAATHSSFGAVKPGIARLPVIARLCGARRSSSAHSAPLRPSFHKMAARRTRSPLSSSVAPCICPDSPMARTAANSRA
jgi:hypothetical protein